MSGKPFADSCRNSDRDDFWTCPGCYSDLGNIGKGVHTCPMCARKIKCTVEHNPSCVTSLFEEDDDDE